MIDLFSINIDNSKSVYAQTLIAMHGVPILVPLNENVANVCDNLLLGRTCPIAQNEMAVYVMKLDIEPYFPEISPSMQISLVNEEREKIACFTWDMNIVANNSLLI